MIEKENSCIVIFNLQREFIPALVDGQNIIDSCYWLADLGSHFNLPVINIHHRDLGTTLPKLLRYKNSLDPIEVTYFSCVQNTEFMELLEKIDKKQIILAGAETHISIFQSAIDLKKLNKEVYVVANAVSSRNLIDSNIGLKRMEKHGIEIITQEMIFFDMIRQSEYPDYIDMSMKFLDNRYIRV